VSFIAPKLSFVVCLSKICRGNMQNALLSALPYLVMWILSLVVAQFADLTARKGWASTNVIRKTANSVGMLLVTSAT
jgi:hypothetical protein